MKKLQLLSMAALLMLVVSCGVCRKAQSSRAESFNLESTSWQVEELNGKAIDTEADNFTLMFNAKNELNGRGACNIIFGDYSQGENGAISLDPKGMTRTACPNMNVEDEYVRMLSTVDSYAVVEGTTLLLFADDVEVAKLQLFKAL